MVSKFSPGSSTKNFGWRKDPRRLHRSIRNGFRRRLEPVTRDAWRGNSGLNDPDIELIPLNFFLFSKQIVNRDYVVADTLVEFALTRPYDLQFAKLAVFAFHLSNSGSWCNTDWPSGRVAGWANLLIREIAWQKGNWTASTFDKEFLLKFIQKHVEGKPETLRKVRNNYWFMLHEAGILSHEELEPINTRWMEKNSQWAIAAPQLFWDRQIFDGKLRASSEAKEFERLFFEHEIHKLMRCSEDQGRATARAAFRDYSANKMAQRFRQIDGLVRVAA